MSVPSNLFGPNYPVHDHGRMVEVLGIRPGDRVLEVGGAGNPFPRANVVCDLTFASSAQRNGAPAVLRDDVLHVESPAEQLPFADGEFDVLYCTQVLEHVRDPAAACGEFTRVARRGFVETPSRLGELLNGNPSHRWIVDLEDGVLVFSPRTFVEHPLRNFFYGVILRDREMMRLAERDYRNLFNVQLAWEGALLCRVRTEPRPRFDYDDPVTAGRAHYAFARNVLAAGAPAEYALPDAIEAARLLPGSQAARLLLAIFQARLLQLDDARGSLAGLTGERAEVVRRAVDRLEAGGAVDLGALPLPGPDPCEGVAAGVREAEAARPLVSVVVFGGDAEALRVAAESALTQDYPRVEVVVAGAVAADELERRFGGLSMGGRLELRPGPPGAGAGALLNQGCLATRGSVLAFLAAGERHLPHHLDRLVSQLCAEGADGVYSDRILATGEGVAGPDVVPGDPATMAASLSTLVVRREALLETGAFDESAGERAPLDMLVRLARQRELSHVREVTVEGRGPVPEGSGLLDVLEAGSRLRGRELARHLMAAHVREEGLRERIRELERRLGGAPGGED